MEKTHIHTQNDTQNGTRMHAHAGELFVPVATTSCNNVVRRCHCRCCCHVIIFVVVFNLAAFVGVAIIVASCVLMRSMLPVSFISLNCRAVFVRGGLKQFKQIIDCVSV